MNKHIRSKVFFVKNVVDNLSQDAILLSLLWEILLMYHGYFVLVSVCLQACVVWPGTLSDTCWEKRLAEEAWLWVECQWWMIFCYLVWMTYCGMLWWSVTEFNASELLETNFCCLHGHESKCGSSCWCGITSEWVPGQYIICLLPLAHLAKCRVVVGSMYVGQSR